MKIFNSFSTLVLWCITFFLLLTSVLSIKCDGWPYRAIRSWRRNRMHCNNDKAGHFYPKIILDFKGRCTFHREMLTSHKWMSPHAVWHAYGVIALIVFGSDVCPTPSSTHILYIQISTPSHLVNIIFLLILWFLYILCSSLYSKLQCLLHGHRTAILVIGLYGYHSLLSKAMTGSICRDSSVDYIK